MNKFLQFAIVLILTTFTIFLSAAIASFFGIGFQDYGVYVIFAVAMIVLYYILPNKPSNIFV